MTPAIRHILLNRARFLPSYAPGFFADYDISDVTTLAVDGSNRVSLVADKSGNSVANCLALPGVASNYASAPHTSGQNTPSDFSVFVQACALDWTLPAARQMFISKDSGGTNRVFTFSQLTTGHLRLDLWNSANVVVSVDSTAIPSLSDFDKVFLGFYVDADNGAGGWDTYFYTSIDGTTWTQLGTTVTTGGGAITIKGGTGTIEVGSNNGGGNRFTGNIYRAAIKTGSLTGGTAVFDANFANVSKLATSFTESSSNAATVTINQTAIALPARIIGERDLCDLLTASQPVYDAATRSITFDGSNDYLKSAPFSLSQPTTVYFVGQQVSWTNNDVIIDGNSGSTMQWYQNSASPRVDSFAGSNLSGASLSWAVGESAVVSAVFNAASSVLRKNRNAALTGNTGSGTPNGFVLGGGFSGLNSANITVSEILIYAAAHDQATQDRIVAALSAKWGIQL